MTSRDISPEEHFNRDTPSPKYTSLLKEYKIMHKKMIANQILEETEWPGKYFPIIFVDGDSFHIYNEQFCIPFIYYAMDPQRFENYLISEIAYMLKTNHRGRYIVDPDAITANTYFTADIDMLLFEQIIAVVQIGTLGAAGTVDFSLVSGAAATPTTAVTNKSITQLADSSPGGSSSDLSCSSILARSRASCSGFGASAVRARG